MLPVLLSGCGNLGGGANYAPTVTMVAAEAGGAGDDASETSATGGGDAAAGGSTAGGFGTLAGRVVMTGSAPTLALLIAKGADVKDKEVCAAVDIADERLVLGEGNGVSNVFVYLPRAPKGGKAMAASEDPMFFDQKNCQFLPHCLIVPTGQVVKVLSGDAVAHNTHTYPLKNQGVNSGVAPNDREGKLEIVYQRAESTPIPVKCDYHAWMSAYHFPIDHPYVAVTDAGGNFTIPDLPAGKHTFAVWHESASGGFVERKLDVTVTADSTTEIQVDYAADKLAL